MRGFFLKVNLGLKFAFWLKVAAKNETDQALQNNVSRIITLSHAHPYTHEGTHAHTQTNSFVAHCSG